MYLSISKNTPIYRLLCATIVIGNDKGHPKVHLNEKKVSWKYMEMWKFWQFLKNRYFSEYKMFFSIGSRLEHIHTANFIWACRGETVASYRKGPVLIEAIPYFVRYQPMYFRVFSDAANIRNISHAKKTTKLNANICIFPSVSENPALSYNLHNLFGIPLVPLHCFEIFQIPCLSKSIFRTPSKR